MKLLLCLVLQLVALETVSAMVPPAGGAATCTELIPVDFTDVVVSGPNGTLLTSELKNLQKTNGLVKRSDGVNVIDYFFMPPVMLARVEMRSKLAETITVDFYDSSNSMVYSDQAKPPFSDLPSSQDSVIDLTSNVAWDIATVRFSFEPWSGEWGVKVFKFFTCMIMPPRPPNPPPNPPPPPPPTTDDPCECRLRGDPIVENCQNKLWFLGPGDFDLSVSDDPSCPYSVTINNGHFNDDANELVVTNYMEITQGSNSIRIYRDHTISVNSGAAEDPPKDLSWASVSKNDDDFVLVELKGCEAKFQFWGQSMATRGILLIPSNIINSGSGRCHENP